MNMLSDIIGVFNCQGAGNWPLKQSPDSESTPLGISSHVRSLDVEYLTEVAGDNWNGHTAIYAFFSGNFLNRSILRKCENDQNTALVSVLTPQIGHEQIFSEGIHFAPLGLIDVYNSGGVIEALSSEGIHFAPLGLIDMYNSGGAIEALSGTSEPPGCKIKIKEQGCGRFGAYSDSEPRYCKVDTKEMEFTYNAKGSEK